MRVLCVLAVLVAVALVGCGESEPAGTDEKLSSALGGAGERDTERLVAYMRVIGGVTEADIAMAKALTDGDRAAARAAERRMARAAREARGIARAMEGARLKAFCSDYSDALDSVVAAYERVLDAPNAISDAELDVLAERIGRAKLHLQRLDRRLLDVMQDVMPRGEYEQLLEHQRRQERRYEEAAGG